MTTLGFCSVLISCSHSDSESISFKKQQSFKLQVENVYTNDVTLVLAVDNSASMLAKVQELEKEMKSMFFGLIDTGWNVDMHVVSCAYFKDSPESLMKMASTKDIPNGSVEDKVELLMSKAAPSIDLSTKNNDADERCNQSLEKAWAQIPFKNIVNVSMVISNEDGCARSEDKLYLPNIPPYRPENELRKNCAPVTHGRLSAYAGFDTDNPLYDKDLETWIDAVTKYSENVWLPWFNKKIKDQVVAPDFFADFFTELEAAGKRKIDYFSHFYVPIVVDTNVCLAESLRNQALLEKENHIDTDEEGNEIPFLRPMNTVGNIGYSYLDTYELLNQNTLFEREKGDLSLCNNLSQIVGNIENEIKLRGRGLSVQLPRSIDLVTTKSVHGNDFNIIRIKRPVDSTGSDLVRIKNANLTALNVSWVLSEDSNHYELDLPLGLPFLKYNESRAKIEVLPNRYVHIMGGDTIEVLDYFPIGFETKTPRIEVIE